MRDCSMWMFRETEERMEHMYYFVRILLIWLLCLLSVFLHELGHALGYRISTGKAKWKIIAGSGPKMTGTSKFIIEDTKKNFYYRGLSEWGNEKGWLIDTCLDGQDTFVKLLDMLEIPYERD